jgi:hypothetical protein
MAVVFVWKKFIRYANFNLFFQLKNYNLNKIFFIQDGFSIYKINVRKKQWVLF